MAATGETAGWGFAADVPVREGRFTSRENKIIKKAVEDFLEVRALAVSPLSPDTPALSSLNGGRSAVNCVRGYLQAHNMKVEQLKEALVRDRREQRDDNLKQFWQHIGMAIPERPLQSLYSHVRRMYHPNNYQAWTPADDEKLAAYVPCLFEIRCGL